MDNNDSTKIEAQPFIVLERQFETDTGFYRIAAYKEQTPFEASREPFDIYKRIFEKDLDSELYMLRDVFSESGIAVRFMPYCKKVVSDKSDHPKIVCLCGSTKFKKAYEDAVLSESLKGKIVLTVICFTHADKINLTHEQKVGADALHKEKIVISHEILVLNVGGYIGDSTMSEIRFAENLGKTISYLEPRG